MSDNNLPAPTGPVDDAPKTFDEGVSDISSLLADPETDLLKEDEDTANAAPVDDEGDDPEIDVSEDVENEDEPEPQDGPQDEIKGGRFAPDSAKVTLDDGTVITVAELKRNNLFQRDYTKKTTEHSEAVKAFEAQRSQVDQQAQSLTQLAERIQAFAQNYLPLPPEPFQGTPQTDPIGYMTYMQQKAAYEDAVAAFQGIGDQSRSVSEATEQEEAEARRKAWAAEAATLIERDRFFADKAKVNSFLSEVVQSGNEWWGLTEGDVNGITSHKQMLILRDALRYRKALAKAPEAQKQVQAKPVMQSGGRRFDPKAKSSAERQARSERLRNTGNIDDAVELLKSLPL
jgi:hypothetical protein